MLLLPLLLLGCPGPDSAAPKDTSPVDADGDGSLSDVDCDDADPAVHPGATELCNFADDDCDGVVDPPTAEGATTWYPDTDGDGFGDDDGATVACTNPGGAIQAGGDCDDTNASVNPDGTERCNDLDDDCDHVIDPSTSVDARTSYADEDGDGYGDPATASVTCDTPAGRVDDASDCDDTRSAVHPEATEICDGRDNNCDDVIDPASSEGTTEWYADADGDGFGDAATSTIACDRPVGFGADATDCDDGDATINPDAVEVCDDVDNNCDGDVDPATSAGAGTWYADSDLDGYGGDVVTVACTAPAGSIATTGDCDDADRDVNPAATEVCDGIDDDCDGSVDPSTSADATVWYPDGDGDGYGDAARGEASCTDPGGRTKIGGDCADADASISPVATEVCDGVDNNCDGATDGGDAVGAGTWYADGDGDGYGGAAVSGCTKPAGSVTNAEDCDDAEATVSPVGTETCNGRDDDCDGVVDPDTSVGAPLWSVDADGDGYGSTTAYAPSCEEPVDAPTDRSDCDDTSADAHPGATELCWTTIDEDCDGHGVSDTECAPGTGTSAIAAWSGSTSFGSAVAVVADVGGDGIADLAATDATDPGAVLILDAMTTVVTTISGDTAGEQFGSSLAALPDFDGDGVGDLAVGAPGIGAVYVFTVGSGTFGAADADARFDSSGDSAGTRVANAGDTDGDGLSDLLVSGPGSDVGGSNAGAAWLVPGGSGSLTLSVDTVATFVGEYKNDSITAIAGAGDVDGDGYDDVVFGATGMDENGSSAGKVYLWRGPFAAGRWEAGAATTRISGGSGDGVGAAVAGLGDLDGNGAPDLVVTATGYDGGSSNAGGIGVWYGPLPRGTMDFADADAMATGSVSGQTTGAALLTAGDLDDDGRDELVFGLGSSVSIAYAGVTGTIRYTDFDAALAGGGVSLATGDLDGDGFDDLVGGDTTSDVVRVWAGGPREETPWAVDLGADDDGDGYSEAAGDCDDGRATRSPALAEVCGAGADEDCDGWADRCLPSGTTDYEDLPATVENSVTTDYGSLGAEVGVVGDLNGDGAQDVAVADSMYDAYAGAVYVWFGPVPELAQSEQDADVTITGAGRRDYLGLYLTRVGDLDGDGFDELAVGNSDWSDWGQTWVFRGGPTLTGDLTLTDATWTFASSWGYDLPVWIAPVGDVNEDGVDDIGIGAPGDYVQDRNETGSVSIFFGPVVPGDYDYDADSDLRIEGEWEGMMLGDHFFPAGDLNGDGHVDLAAWAIETTDSILDDTQTMYVFFGPFTSGVITASAADVWIPVEASKQAEAVAAGDLSGDGFPDLVIPSGSSQLDVVSFIGARGPATIADLSVATITSSGLSGRDHASAGIGDIDGDGQMDLVLSGTDPYGDDGRVVAYTGPLSGAVTSASAAFTLTTSSSYTDFFGYTLAVGDTDGDGFADVVVGAMDMNDGHTLWMPGGFVVVRGGWRSGGAHGAPVTADLAADVDGDGVSPAGGDCDDADATIHPGAAEVCDGPIDEDCDGIALACAPLGVVALADPPRTADISIDACPPILLGDWTGDGLDEQLFASSSGFYRLDSPFPTWEAPYYTAYDGAVDNGSYSDTPTDWTAVGDLDGDGFPEVMWGASARYVATVLLSGDGWDDRTWGDFTWRIAGAKNSLFGSYVASGDVDGDGSDDMVVAATGDDTVATDAGAVYVFDGSMASGVRGTADAWWTIQGDTAAYGIGVGLAGLGDLDGDGLDELAYTEARSTSTDLDRTYVWTGDATGGVVSTADAPIQLVRGASGLGGALPFAPGDLDGDGHGDLVLGAPDWLDAGTGASGRVYVWSGLPTIGETNQVDADLIVDGMVWRGAFGTSVSPWIDLDDDGAGELIVGAPQSSGYAVVDRVYGWYGPIVIAGAWSAEGADMILEDDEDGLGTTVTPAGDVDGDGFSDLWAADTSTAWLWRGGVR